MAVFEALELPLRTIRRSDPKLPGFLGESALPNRLYTGGVERGASFFRLEGDVVVPLDEFRAAATDDPVKAIAAYPFEL